LGLRACPIGGPDTVASSGFGIGKHESSYFVLSQDCFGSSDSCAILYGF
jgi:hypothetical protein